MKPSEKEEKWSPTDCGQNLPAVLNDPKKGKQRDFFTRSWGDSFVDGLPIGSSPYLYQLSEHAFDRYIRRIRKHFRPNGASKGALSLVNGPSKKAIPPISGVPKFFMSEDFDLMKPEVFSYIFPFLMNSSNGFSCFSSQSRDVVESISQHLDLVEINLGHHLAQKYYHFFQVMAYQDALMSQLKALIRVVRELRGDLRALYEPMNLSLKISQLVRRKNNAEVVRTRLNSMRSLHQSQPTIQLLLSGSEFSGALDLIKTSQDILGVELVGVRALRYLPPQLEEITAVIGNVLVSDFRKIIVEEVEKHTFLKRATMLDANSDLDFNEGKLYSIIHGLILLNSFTFPSELEESCANAVENIIRKCVSVLPHSKDEVSTPSFRVGEFASIATPEGWTDLFDMLLGSLIVLLRRVKLVQELILTVIKKVNPSQKSTVSQHEVYSIEDSSYQVLVNVCDLINERCSGLLKLRSRPQALPLMTLSELKSIEKIICILNEDIRALKFGSQGNCLVLVLQTQFLEFIQHFDDRIRNRIKSIVNSERWAKRDVDMGDLHEKCARFPQLTAHLDSKNEGGSISFKDESSPSYDILGCAQEFLYILVEYLHLARELPGIRSDLGFKVATVFAHFNSVVCQYILGLAALKFQVLEKVGIPHLILTHNSIDFVSIFIPLLANEFVFEEDTRKEGLNNQFEKSRSRYSDHKEEILRKISETLQTIMRKEFLSWSWESKKSVPSGNFKQICHSINVFVQMASPTLPRRALEQILMEVHAGFIHLVRTEIKANERKSPKVDRVSRDLLLEMIYYGQSLQRITNIIPPQRASNDFFEKELWK